MKIGKKLVASALSFGMLLSALPLPAVSAAEETPDMTAKITLNDNTAVFEGDNVTVEGNIITITASGSYEISGTLTDGQIRVSVADEVADPGTVKLFFNGVNITGVSEAAVYVVNAENTSINLVEGTENFIYDGETYSESTAAIFAKDDITIKGEGYLRVEATYQYGLHCNNDVKITGGNIKFKTAAADAIRGKTSVEVKGGVIDINAGGDGIKSTKGNVLISGGTIDVKASNDAVQAETRLEISGGTLKANGDRGLTCATTGEGVALLGGTVLATATDYAIPNLIAGDQPIVNLTFDAETVKDRALTFSQNGTPVYSMTSDKKFTYATVSAPEITAGQTYDITLGTQKVTSSDGAVFTVGEGITELAGVHAPAEFICDPNLDGETNIADAVLMCRYIAEDAEAVVPTEGTVYLDCNGDGTVDAMDTAMLLRYLAGILEE